MKNRGNFVVPDRRSRCRSASTVLVFKALSEWANRVRPQWRRAIGILLFPKDAALVPLLLLVPFVDGFGEHTGGRRLT